MSLTNRKVFLLAPGRKAVSYDKNFLVVGNSEIVIKQGEKKVFSNFGNPSGFFKPNGADVSDFLGEGKQREAKIVGFEVHQVLFDWNYDGYVHKKNSLTYKTVKIIIMIALSFIPSHIYLYSYLINDGVAVGGEGTWQQKWRFERIADSNSAGGGRLRQQILLYFGGQEGKKTGGDAEQEDTHAGVEKQ